jgi:hypothetical protein
VHRDGRNQYHLSHIEPRVGPPACHIASTSFPPQFQHPLISCHVHPHGPSSVHRPLASLQVSLPPSHIHLSTFHHSHVPLSSMSPPPVSFSDRVASLSRCHSSRHRLYSVHTFTPSSHPHPHPPQGFPRSIPTVQLIQVAPGGDLHVPGGRVD